MAHEGPREIEGEALRVRLGSVNEPSGWGGRLETDLARGWSPDCQENLGMVPALCLRGWALRVEQTQPWE